jgi:putative ATPase
MISNQSPLANRMRPIDLKDFVGQKAISDPNKLLSKAIASNSLPSLIFWGPPGTGKTTLALILANKLKADFIRFSAVTEGVRDLRRVIGQARNNALLEKQTILFIDEIHRWNKAQQDALLPHLENGTITLIGATTENPSFEIRGALLSRARVIILNALNVDSLIIILQRAIADKDNGLGKIDIKIDDDNLKLIANLSNGDARTALNILDASSLLSSNITKEIITEASQQISLKHDKTGENHYNLISALHKSMRGSDASASLYWLARMLEAGEDSLYIARRLVRFASEDIGLANSQALNQAVAVYNACRFLGLPECKLHLAQAVVYMAKCKKSNKLYTAYSKASNDAKETGDLSVPLHLRNASTSLMKDLGYGKGYKYSPNFDYQEDQDYFPDQLKHKKYI